MSLRSRSNTSSEIDSGVWPGVSSASRRTRPSSIASPSCSGDERVLGLRLGAQVDGRAGPIAQLEVAGEEVGVQVRQEHVRDAQAVLAREREVLLDVALRIDDGGHAGVLVADEIRRVRETVQIELLEDHAAAPRGPAVVQCGSLARSLP